MREKGRKEKRGTGFHKQMCAKHSYECIREKGGKGGILFYKQLHRPQKESGTLGTKWEWEATEARSSCQTRTWTAHCIVLDLSQ